MLHANWLNEGDVKVVGKSKVGLIGAIAMGLTIAMGSEISVAREIRSKILQEKLGRLYFSAGKDEDVWPGCRWRVYRDSTDTIKSVCEGRIAESYEGVSISDSIVNLPTQFTSSSMARIEAADTLRETIVGAAFIDRIDDAVFGNERLYNEAVRAQYVRYSTDERGSPFADQNGVVVRVDRAEIYPIDIIYKVAIHPLSFYSRCNDLPPFPFSETHVELSYWETPCTNGMRALSIDASFFVALIPNVSRPVNRNALLTTALRYRIDTSQINNAFEFESVPQLSFLPGAHSYSAFTADISKAKKLLKENKTAGASVSIDTYSPTLKSTSRYLQGTLTQAGYATTTVGWNEPADLRLAILPIYSDSPWVALREVLTSIAKDTIAKDKANQPVRLADQLLNDALATSDSTRRIQLLERVDRMLMEDIGAFPLFRPIIYVCAKEEIRGIKFDKDGRLDLRSIYRLKLPGDSAEVNR